VKNNWYYKSAEGIMAALWTTNPMTVALLKPTYTPNLDTHLTWADVSAQEVVGTGYTSPGQLLAGKPGTPVYNPGTDRTDLQANDSVWGPGASFTAHYAVIYDNSGSKPLWALVDFEADQTVSNGTFTLDWQSVGLLYIIPAP